MTTNEPGKRLSYFRFFVVKRKSFRNYVSREFSFSSIDVRLSARAVVEYFFSRTFSLSSQHESSDFADWICLFCLQRGRKQGLASKKIATLILSPGWNGMQEKKRGCVLSFFLLSPLLCHCARKKAIFSEIFPKDFVPFLFVRDRTRREGENDFIFSIFSSTRHCSFGTRCANNCVFCHYLLQWWIHKSNVERCGIDHSELSLIANFHTNSC